MLKNFKKNKLIQYFLAYLAVIFIYIVRYTSKINIVNEKFPKKFWKKNQPFILVFWHSQLMMISYSWVKNKKINILASDHSDGRFGAIIGSYFKLRNIERPSKKSNMALKNIFKLVKKNEYIGITPDGPRGPNQKVSEGVIKIASSLQIPIIPCGFWSSKNLQLKSWDKFLITLPFSKCYFVWSKPMYVNKKISKNMQKKFQYELEKQLNRNIGEAKKLTNK